MPAWAETERRPTRTLDNLNSLRLRGDFRSNEHDPEHGAASWLLPLIVAARLASSRAEN
jgi:hypothetical protein